MWSLKYEGEAVSNSKSPEEVQLLSGKEFVVGRKDCEILLKDDPSISRKHATLKVVFPENQVSDAAALPVLSLTDFSKFGTFIKGSKLNGSTCTLADGEEVKFGQMNNIYRAKYTPLIVATSSLPSAEKIKLKQCLQKLGAHQVNDWVDTCSMLIMGKIAVTVKAVCALASPKPIVTVDYLEKLIHSVETNQPKPDINSFIPALPGEADEHLLKPTPKRQKLFTGKTFHFCNKSQFDRMKISVKLAGGTPLLLESKPRSLAQLTADNAIFMYCDPKTQPAWYKDCSTYLTRKHKRYIQDAEIGHAILYCSTEKHCNAAMHAGSQLHEEFSQKLQNTQTATQTQPQSNKASASARSTRSAAADISTSMLAPDSQMSTRATRGNRSIHVSDMLPPPDVTTILETQKADKSVLSSPVTGKKVVKTEPKKATPQAKRKSELTDTQQPREKMPRASTRQSAATMSTFDPPAVTSTKATVDNILDSFMGDNSELVNNTNKINSTTQSDRHTDTVSSAQITVNNDSTMPSMRDTATPSKITRDIPQEMTDFDASIVEETQSSGTSTRKENHNISDVKVGMADQSETAGFDQSETPGVQNGAKCEVAVDRLNTIKREPMQASQLQDYTEERRVEIGEQWDLMQIDYASLICKSRPVRENTGIEEREGMALWKGRWVPNFKKFNKCGKKDDNRLPTIIGGRDFVDALCSQPSQSDFIQAPQDPEPVRPVNWDVTGRTSRQAPAAKTTIKSSVFGGQWELPTRK